MRVLRRVCGAMRMPGNRISDIEVRRRLLVPSVQHVVRRNRLVYLASVLRSPAVHLKALIAVKQPSGLPQPWTESVRQDLVALWRHFPNKLAWLGHPLEMPCRWHELMVTHPGAWKSIVKSWHEDMPPMTQHTHPGGDSKRRRKVFEKEGGALAHPHVCVQCSQGFCSERALRMHCRIAHGARCHTKWYADSDGMCPVCFNFSHLAFGWLPI